MRYTRTIAHLRWKRNRPVPLPLRDAMERPVVRTPGDRWESMRLIAMSGYGQDSDLERARVAGFDLYLVKPFDSRNLQEMLADLFHE